MFETHDEHAATKRPDVALVLPRARHVAVAHDHLPNL